MTRFALHERLAADTLFVADLGLSTVRLMNERTWPWLILVPRRTAVAQISDLAAADRLLLIEEIALAEAALRRLYRPDRINVGALGNIVPQLHVHVVARFKSDPAWPRPVWGAKAPDPYPPAAAADTIRRCAGALTAL
jgi:diadenosine tetraphosphate (Ap4A) HIT family hydrolase